MKRPTELIEKLKVSSVTGAGKPTVEAVTTLLSWIEVLERAIKLWRATELEARDASN